MNALDWVLLFLAAAGLPAWAFFTGRRFQDSARALRYWIIAVRGVALSALVLYDWRSAGRPLATLGLDAPLGTGGRVGLAIAAAFVTYVFASAHFGNRAPAQRAATRSRLERLGTYRLLPQTPREFVLFPVAAISGSICEELLYRGFWIGALSPLMGAPAAVLSSSAAFGLGHAYQGRIGVLRTSVIGLAFGTAFALTHSLWWLLVVHVAANLSGALVARRLASEPAQG